MTTVRLTKSPRDGKRLRAEFVKPGVMKNKVVDFGAENGSTYIDHRDKKKKENYLKRHGAMGTQNWEDIETPGALSRWLLWSEPTLAEAIKHVEKKFNVRIVNDI